MKMPTLSLIIPMYNESKIIRDTISKINAFMDIAFYQYEVIYVDDGSTDDTAEIVKKEITGDPYSTLISYSPNRGKGHAVKEGMLAASGDICIFTDSDLAFGLDSLRVFYEQFVLHPDTDVIIGSRSKHPEGYKGYTALRKIASKTYLKFLNVVGGLKLSDSQTGIKGFTQKAAKKIFSKAETDGFAFDFEVLSLAQKAGYKIEELPVKIINHRESTVHLVSDAIKMTKEVFRIKRRVKKVEI